MSKDFNRQLDKDLRRDRLRNIRVLSYFLIPLLLIGIYAIGFIGSVQSNVVGEVKSHYASLNEDGHDLYMMVKLPDRAALAKVKLPKAVVINVGAQVELSARTNRFFNNTKYRFVKYVE